jgi:hypothetical protein
MSDVVGPSSLIRGVMPSDRQIHEGAPWESRPSFIGEADPAIPFGRG